MDMSLDKAEAAMVAKELKQLLLDAVPLSCNLPRATLPNYDNIPGNLMLSSLGLKLGDRVVLDDMKVRGSLAVRDYISLHANRDWCWCQRLEWHWHWILDCAIVCLNIQVNYRKSPYPVHFACWQIKTVTVINLRLCNDRKDTSAPSFSSPNDL